MVGEFHGGERRVAAILTSSEKLARKFSPLPKFFLALRRDGHERDEYHRLAARTRRRSRLPVDAYTQPR